MNDSEPDKKAEQTSAGADASRIARRRLLKVGAYAAPLVLTFKSGAAWAISGGCKLQSGTQPIPGVFTVTSPPYNGTTVTIDQTADSIVTNQSNLTSDQLKFLVDNGNLTGSCYTSIMTVAP